MTVKVRKRKLAAIEVGSENGSLNGTIERTAVDTSNLSSKSVWPPSLYNGAKLDTETINYIHRIYCRECRMEEQKKTTSSKDSGGSGSEPPTSPQQVVEEGSLQQSMDKNKESLKRKLMIRRSLNELVDQGIYPPLKTPAAFAEQRKQLERAKTGDILRHKLENRPDRQDLVQHHILEDTKIDPSLQERQRQLKKARLQDSLSDKLQHRPGPLELVQSNILTVDQSVKDALDEGKLQFPHTSTDDSSSNWDGGMDYDTGVSSDGGVSPIQSTSESSCSEFPSVTSPAPSSSNSSIPTPPDITPLLQKLQSSVSAGTSFTFTPLSSTQAGQSFVALTNTKPTSFINLNTVRDKQSRKNLKAKQKPKPSKVIKFHEYKGPPSVVKTQQSEQQTQNDINSYNLLLQQQQLLLQWQLEVQNKGNTVVQAPGATGLPTTILTPGTTLPLVAKSDATSPQLTFPSPRVTPTGTPILQTTPMSTPMASPSPSPQLSVTPQPMVTLVHAPVPSPIPPQTPPTPTPSNPSPQIPPPAPPPPPPPPPAPSVISQPVKIVSSISTSPQVSIAKPVTVTNTSSTASVVTSPTSTIGSAVTITKPPKIFHKFEDMKVAELKAECKKRGLPVSGPKPNLIEKLKPFADSILTPLSPSQASAIASVAPNTLNMLNTPNSQGASSISSKESQMTSPPPSVGSLNSLGSIMNPSSATAYSEEQMTSPPMSPESYIDLNASIASVLSQPVSPPDDMDTTTNFNTKPIEPPTSQPIIPMSVDQASRPPSVAPMDIDLSASLSNVNTAGHITKPITSAVSLLHTNIPGSTAKVITIQPRTGENGIVTQTAIPTSIQLPNVSGTQKLHVTAVPLHQHGQPQVQLPVSQITGVSLPTFKRAVKVPMPVPVRIPVASSGLRMPTQFAVPVSQVANSGLLKQGAATQLLTRVQTPASQIQQVTPGTSLPQQVKIQIQQSPGNKNHIPVTPQVQKQILAQLQSQGLLHLNPTGPTSISVSTPFIKPSVTSTITTNASMPGASTTTTIGTTYSTPTATSILVKNMNAPQPHHMTQQQRQIEELRNQLAQSQVRLQEAQKQAQEHQEQLRKLTLAKLATITQQNALNALLAQQAQQSQTQAALDHQMQQQVLQQQYPQQPNANTMVKTETNGKPKAKNNGKPSVMQFPAFTQIRLNPIQTGPPPLNPPAKISPPPEIREGFPPVINIKPEAEDDMDVFMQTQSLHDSLNTLNQSLPGFENIQSPPNGAHSADNTGLNKQQSMSVPTSPVGHGKLHRSATNPFFADLPLRDPPGYAEAMKNKQNLLMNRQTDDKQEGGNTTDKGHTMDDVLEILINSGELPASVADGLPTTPKPAASGSPTSSLGSVVSPSTASSTQSAPTYPISNGYQFISQPNLITSSGMLLDANSLMALGINGQAAQMSQANMNSFSPSTLTCAAQPGTSSDRDTKTPLSNIDINECNIANTGDTLMEFDITANSPGGVDLSGHDLDFIMDWSDPDLAVSLLNQTSCGVLDNKNFVFVNSPAPSFTNSTASSESQDIFRGTSSATVNAESSALKPVPTGSENDTFASLSLNDLDLQQPSTSTTNLSCDVADWLDAIMPSTGLTPLSTNAPVSFGQSDPVLTPKTQDVLELFNMSEDSELCNTSQCSDIVSNFDKIMEASSSST